MPSKSICINQPYFFPYIGFFQLLHASDKFISLEDVNFIPGGWINRNRILINGKPAYFTVPVEDASQNRPINKTRVHMRSDIRDELLKKLRISYSRAPYYSDTFMLVRNALSTPSDVIADISMQSILEVCNYIGLRKQFGKSNDETGLKGADKIIDICRREGVSEYINLPGGKELYSEDRFAGAGIALKFLKPELNEYKQFGNPFVPGLSIIDVLAFNPPERVLEMVSNYSLE